MSDPVLELVIDGLRHEIDQLQRTHAAMIDLLADECLERIAERVAWDRIYQQLRTEHAQMTAVWHRANGWAAWESDVENAGAES